MSEKQELVCVCNSVFTCPIHQVPTSEEREKPPYGCPERRPTPTPDPLEEAAAMRAAFVEWCKPDESTEDYEPGFWRCWKDAWKAALAHREGK